MLRRLAICVLTIGVCACSDRLAEMQSVCTGTWQLEVRTLPDGSTIRPPQINGSFHWEPIDSRKAHVSLTLLTEEDDKQVLDHSLSTYEISTSAITRKRRVLIQRGYRDRVGNPLSHYIRGRTAKGKASVDGNEITFFHAAKGETGVDKGNDQGFKQVYSGDVMTASYTNGWTDTWRRIR